MTADLSAYDPEARLASYDPEAFLTGRRTPVEDVRPPVERHLARKIIEAYLITLVAMRALDWLGLAKRWQTDGWVQEEIDKNVTQQFVHAFSAPMSVLLAQAAHKGHEDARVNYKLTESAAVGVEAWSRTYAAESANTMALAQERALQDTVNDMINQRLPPQVMADRAAAMYGLDPASAQAFNRFSASKSKARSETLPQMLRRLTFRRAKTIADTEIFTAMNFGHQMRLMEAMAMGEIPRSARKRWVTANDERVCPVCGPMDGIAVPMNDAFEVVMPIPKTSRGKNRKSSFLFVPPVHPNCRCEIELADKEYVTPVAPREMAISKLFTESKHKRDRGGKFSSTEYKAAGALTGSAVVGTAGYKGFDHVAAAKQAGWFVEGKDGGGYWPNAEDEMNLKRWQRRFKPNDKTLYRGVRFFMKEAPGTPEDVIQALRESSLLQFGDSPRHFSDGRHGVDHYLHRAAQVGSDYRVPVVLELPKGMGHSAEAKPGFGGAVIGVHGVTGNYDIAHASIQDNAKVGKVLKVVLRRV